MLALIVLLQALTLAVSGPATSPEYLPIWVAAGHGHFDRQGLRITLKSTRSEVGAAEALAQGQADLVATSLEAILRFGIRDAQNPRLFFGLTAAPPVALVIDTRHAGRVRTVQDLAGFRVGLSAPGAPEHAWLNALLARAGLTPSQVHILSVGERGLERALIAGDVHAVIVPDPAATRLLAERRGNLLADLRTPVDAQRALDAPTVNAAVFLRVERHVGEKELAAFARAVLAAEDLITAGATSALAAKLPRNVVGTTEEFEARVQQAKTLYLARGRVTGKQLESTQDFLRDQLSLPSRARLQLLMPGRLGVIPGQPLR